MYSFNHVFTYNYYEYIHVQSCTYMYIHIYIHTYIIIHTYIYIYVYTHLYVERENTHEAVHCTVYI